MEEKKAIRKQIFAERKACSDKEIQEWSKEITKNITALPEYQTADRILVYADYNHEVMTGFLIEKAWADGKEIAVPKVQGLDMIFYKLTDFAQLEPGYYGIPEPVSTMALCVITVSFVSRWWVTFTNIITAVSIMGISCSTTLLPEHRATLV